MLTGLHSLQSAVCMACCFFFSGFLFGSLNGFCLIFICFFFPVLCPDIRHQISYIAHHDQTSDMRRRASDVGHHTLDIARRTSDIGYRTSDIRHRISDVGHQTWDIRHRTSDISRRTSLVRHRLSDIRHHK